MKGALLLSLALVLTVCSPGETPANSQARSLAGGIGGADYRLEVPAGWNGTLFLYSHGYVAPGQPNPAMDAPGPDEVIRSWLLGHGYAIAGSAYSSTGWAIEAALKDQIALLDLFQKRVAKPKRVIAWGHSMGGLITAGLAQLNPARFAAAIPMCGVLSGGVAHFNTALDAAYAFRVLLAPGSNLALVGITDPSANLQLATATFRDSVSTPAGIARIALAGALADLPGWYELTRPEPAAGDLGAWMTAQETWFSRSLLPTAFASHADLERRAGGNPSWNIGVDYHHQLSISRDRDRVAALYSAAGLDLETDLRTLEAGPRVKADAQAVAYLDSNLSLDGQLSVPVLSMHTTADGLVIPQTETAYGDIVRAAGKEGLLRQAFVHRAGHCTFTAAETITVVRSILNRLDKGAWDDSALRPTSLNTQAQALGARYQAHGAMFVSPAAFVQFDPGTYPRPFTKGSSPPA